MTKSPWRSKSEYRFQDRLIRILRDKGFLVINAASKQLFDIVAIKGQIAYPIEVKAKKTRYPPEQITRQIARCNSTQNCFYLIQQSHKRGKFCIIQYAPQDRGTLPDTALFNVLQEEVEEYLE